MRSTGPRGLARPPRLTTVSEVSTFAIETDEYAAATTAAGWVDRSERGKLALTGADAKEFLQGQVSNDVVALTPGSGCYAAFLTPKGKMLGDLRILDTGDELLLDTERIALQELFNMIRRFSLGHDVQLHKRTLEARPDLADRPRQRSDLRRSRRCPRLSTRTLAATLDGIDVRRRPDRRGDRPDLRVRSDRRADARAQRAGRRADLGRDRRVCPDRAGPPPIRGRPR